MSGAFVSEALGLAVLSGKSITAVDPDLWVKVVILVRPLLAQFHRRHRRPDFPVWLPRLEPLRERGSSHVVTKLSVSKEPPLSTYRQILMPCPRVWRRLVRDPRWGRWNEFRDTHPTSIQHGDDPPRAVQKWMAQMVRIDSTESELTPTHGSAVSKRKSLGWAIANSPKTEITMGSLGTMTRE